ncbi:hypothetical protein UFOVP699_147 [uncultured Caudovirales phage]|uniref:Uncharacterized protein n=1 Tax=uncultured Caudovirales phage TaxID=2100421 RepID=A0A6J5NPY0_9CAUD|nr:hypothetical protein UFOVP699_147 [uncultured Caudovirales phage]
MRTKEQYAEDLGDNVTRVFGPCVFTGEEYSCEVPTDGLLRFLAGEHAQAALPNVSADDREFLISGISPAGWTKTFG